MEKFRAIVHDGLIFHKHPDQRSRAEIKYRRHHCQERHRNFHCKANGLFHAGRISAGKIIADQRHNSLGKPHGNIHGNHIDLLHDSHGGHRVSPVG